MKYVVGVVMLCFALLGSINLLTNIFNSNMIPYLKSHQDSDYYLKTKHIWRHLSLRERFDYIWYNTFIFIPNQPGNPYTLFSKQFNVNKKEEIFS